MAPKIFVTGVTGYIAGDAFYALNQKYPEYEYTCLVRTQPKADLVQKQYPSARIVIGDLDSSKLLEEEASKADIVLHAADASDHEGAAKAIASGLISGHTKDHPGFWLHTGGTGILTWKDSKNNVLGEWSEEEYNDWDGVEALTTLPDDAFHRNVDKLVLEAGTKHSDVLKTAIVCPPTIYGKGRGPDSGRGRQVYELANLILTTQSIPIIGKGLARWNHIHIHDLSEVYILLVEAALSSTSSQNESELWGPKGYYLTESGEHIWGDLSRLIGAAAVDMGYLQENLPENSLGKEKALEVAGFEAVSWGLNSRGKSLRANKLLGWTPKADSLEASVKEVLQDEKKRSASK